MSPKRNIRLKLVLIPAMTTVFLAFFATGAYAAGKTDDNCGFVNLIKGPYDHLINSIANLSYFIPGVVFAALVIGTLAIISSIGRKILGYALGVAALGMIIGLAPKILDLFITSSC
jgi:hypothetical protein